MVQRQCQYCEQPFLVGLRMCPHCSRPSLFPNVELAGLPEELEAVRTRYDAAVTAAEAAGRKAAINRLEEHINHSTASIGLRRWDLDRLVSSDSAVAATYFQQISAPTRIPDDDRWERLRRIAHAIFFETYGADVHFAALCTEDRWLSNYGDGALFFKEEMISYRATLFEKNTAQWVEENAGSMHVPPGHRALWRDRHLLAVAKLAASITDTTLLGPLLLSCGQTSSSDSFIEVHICGTFSIRSTNAVVVKREALSELSRKALYARGTELGFVVTELP